MPTEAVTFKVGDKVKCKCHEWCDAILVIVEILDKHEYYPNRNLFLVEHFDHHSNERMFITDESIELFEATA